MNVFYRDIDMSQDLFGWVTLAAEHVEQRRELG
jgi:hypothetical protein